MSQNSVRAWNTVLFGLLTGLSILGVGATMAESEITFINIWSFLIVLLMAGLGLGYFFRRTMLCRAWPGMPEWVNIIFVGVIFTCISGGTVLLVNSLCGDTEKMNEKEVVVERKFYKTRHKTQTTGRRSSSTGVPYHVHYLTLRFDDGREMDLQPEYSVYKKAEKGDTAYIKVGRGALGLTVCEASSLRLKHPDKKKSRRRFYGRR